MAVKIRSRTQNVYQDISGCGSPTHQRQPGRGSESVQADHRLHPGYWECTYLDEIGEVKGKIKGYVNLLARTAYTGDVYESLDRLFQYLAELLYESYLVCLGHDSQLECEQSGGQCVWRHIPAYPPSAPGGTNRCVPRNLQLDQMGPAQPLQLLYPSEAAMTQRVQELFRVYPKAFDIPVGNGQVFVPVTQKH